MPKRDLLAFVESKDCARRVPMLQCVLNVATVAVQIVTFHCLAVKGFSVEAGKMFVSVKKSATRTSSRVLQHTRRIQLVPVVITDVTLMRNVSCAGTKVHLKL